MIPTWLNIAQQDFKSKRMKIVAILFYRTVFDNETEFPVISECIKIDHKLHVKLQHNGKYVGISSKIVSSWTFCEVDVLHGPSGK